MADGEACVINIGPGQRRRRFTVGVVGLLLGVGAAVAIAALGLAWPIRLATALPFFVGASGIFQARAKT